MRAYFLGAGASKQDGFPLTSELRYGIAWAIHEDPDRFRDLVAHLRHLFNVDERVLTENCARWQELRKGRKPAPGAPGDPLPDVTDWLSTLDWMIREQSSFGPGRDTQGASKTSLLAQLTQVRDLVVQALCLALGCYECEATSVATTERFMDLVQPDDLLITSNWDLLLDLARDERFGTAAGDYGTGGSNVVLENEHPPRPARPHLLKLHGSLSWRYCPRCQRLVIDPRNHVAGDRSEKPNCKCSYPFSELIVTPGFVREYRNGHLLNIWREALFGLAFADEWVFVGYSLPPDDVGIRALLLRARCIREDLQSDAAKKWPKVTVVSGDDRQSVCSRYRSILPETELYPHDFGTYVNDKLELAT